VSVQPKASWAPRGRRRKKDSGGKGQFRPKSGPQGHLEKKIKRERKERNLFASKNPCGQPKRNVHRNSAPHAKKKFSYNPQYQASGKRKKG